MTRPQGHASDVQHKIAMAKEQRRKALEEQERQNKTQADKAARDMEIERTKGGLNVAYHPALMMDTQKALMHVKDQMYHNRQQPGTSLESLLSKQEKKAEVVEKVNPYLDPMDRIRTAETPKPRISRTLKFAEPGKFINIASNLRAQVLTINPGKSCKAQAGNRAIGKSRWT